MAAPMYYTGYATLILKVKGVGEGAYHTLELTVTELEVIPERAEQAPADRLNWKQTPSNIRIRRPEVRATVAQMPTAMANLFAPAPAPKEVPPRQQVLKALDAGNVVELMALADIAEEEGETFLAEAWRFLAKERKAPYMNQKRQYVWGRATGFRNVPFNIREQAAHLSNHSAALPEEAYKYVSTMVLDDRNDRMIDGDGNEVRMPVAYYSPIYAYEAAANALATMYKEQAK